MPMSVRHHGGRITNEPSVLPWSVCSTSKPSASKMPTTSAVGTATPMSVSSRWRVMLTVGRSIGAG